MRSKAFSKRRARPLDPAEAALTGLPVAVPRPADILSEAEQRLVIQKIIWRILPLLFLGSFIGIIDRVNIGFAAAQMRPALSLSAMAFGWGVGLFFFGYLVCEIPATLAVGRFGGRFSLSLMMLLWSVTSGAMAFAANLTTFLLLRFFLGVVEAGFNPGILLFISTWLPSRHRGAGFSLALLAGPLATATGAMISGWVLHDLHLPNLAPWQSMFVIEAAPAFLLAIAMIVLLRNKPSQASWLPPAEKNWLANEIYGASPPSGKPREHVAAVFKNWTLVRLAVVHIGLGGIGASITYWLPEAISMRGFSSTESGVIMGTPYLLAAAAMPLWSRRSDARLERKFHLLIPTAVAPVALALCVLAPWPTAKFVLICACVIAMYVSLPVSWSVVSEFFPGEQTAPAIALLTLSTGISGVFWPVITGWLRDVSGDFSASFLLVSGFGLITSINLLWINWRMLKSLTAEPPPASLIR